MASDQQTNEELGKKCKHVKCHSVVEPGCSRCLAHRVQRMKTRKRKQDKLRTESKCPRCGSERQDFQFVNCEQCRSTVRSYYARVHEQTCHRAGCLEPTGSRWLCVVHSRENAKRRRERREKRRRNSECYICGVKIDGESARCSNCRFKDNEANQRYRAKLRATKQSEIAREHVQGVQDSPVAAESCEQQQSFVAFVCNRQDDDEADVAKILLEMSEPRDALQPSEKWNAIKN